MKVLIVEDDKEISGILSEFLMSNEYNTICVYDGNEAEKILKSQDYGLVLMDLMLPGKSGEQLIKELREYSDVPVIVLSAKSMMETRLEVLRLGADDYILKPFDLDEVLVRIEVVLRRAKSDGNEDGKILSCGMIKLNLDQNRAECNDKEISLTMKELSILKLFMENPKKTFTKANLYEAVWDDVYYYEDNTINVHISNLRNKLKKMAGQDIIETVWGIGYRLKEMSV